MRTSIACAALIAAFTSFAPAIAQVPANNSNTKMAPIEKYLLPSSGAEVALAREGGPSAIADHAEILVLTKTGYITAVKGTNGWTCFVSRSWTAGLNDPEFWNWRGVGPACLNPPAVRSVLPQYIARTNWAIAGNSLEQIATKCKAAYASRQFTDPAPGSIAFMLSKHGYLLGVDGPWHPHVMPFVAYAQLATWGVGFKGSPVIGPDPALFREYEPVTIAIPVKRWSDGSLGPK